MSEELKRGIPKAIIVGRVEFTEKEAARHKREFEEILKEMGVIGEKESIDDYEEVNTI